MKLSELIRDYEPDAQRRLYNQFVRGVARGEVMALKVLDQMQLIKRDGTPRTVQDFVIPTSTIQELTHWFSEQAKPTSRSGITAEAAAKLTDDELLELIQKNRRKKAARTTTKKARKPRAKKITSEHPAETPENT